MRVEELLAKLSNGNYNEPVFCLRASDLLAPEVIRFWCKKALEYGVNNNKIASALNVAEEMLRGNGNRKLPD